mgnify:CR=1 FL=1
MTWLVDHWIDLLGWGGSILLIWSVLQTRLLKFRVLNCIASLVLTLFNAVLAIWPMVAMNFVLALINLLHIRSLLGQQRDETAFDILQVEPDDRYLQHVLAAHAADIASFQPDFDPTDHDRRRAFLVQLGDETVGVVMLRPEGQTAHVVLDWVNPRYRDFSPGQYVWHGSNLLRTQGFERVETSPQMVAPYYGRLGFTKQSSESGTNYVWDVPTA